jgi:hypothetical protein
MNEPLNTAVVRAIYEDARFSDEFLGRHSRTDVPALCDALDEARRAADLWKAAEKAQTDLLRQVFDALGGDPVRDTVDALAQRLRADISAFVAERDRLAKQVEAVRSVCMNTDGDYLDGDVEIPVGEVLRMLTLDGRISLDAPSKDQP